ncbi:MAG TPA: hypothetical protein VK498_12060 [Ferruginibacter sp.]|nr:hypothetical protein [Ferruginibacter sp.]
MQQVIGAINYSLQNKLQNLVSFLSQVNKGFDAIAEEIDNTNLKTAMLAVAVECKQYAREISNQLKQLDICLPVAYTDQLWDKIEENINEHAYLARGGEIVALCNNCELYFGKLYEDVLKEYFPYKNLKDIITYQLYASQCAFMKIRLLNTLRFN